MSHGSRYPPRGGGGDSRRDYDGYDGHRDNNRDRDRNGRDRHNDRDFRRNSPPRGPGPGPDSYRPASYSHRDNLYNSQDTRRQPSGYDSWAPGTEGYHPPPPSYSQPPPPLSLPRDGPQPPQGDFSFRVDKPAGVQDSYNSYRPSGQNENGHAYPPGGQSYRSAPSNRRGRGRDGRGGRGGYVRFKAADRPMLNPLHTTEPEQFFFDAETKPTYRPLTELSDSSDAEMDVSDGEDKEGTPREPTGKRARLGVRKSALEDSEPKWSNPDPYTALPPPDAAAKPRRDVVQLIRKARVESNDAKASIPAEAADFISCDFDDSDDESDLEVIGVRKATQTDTFGVSGAHNGPHSVQPPHQTLTSAGAPGPQPTDLARSGLANLISNHSQPTQLAVAEQLSLARSNENTLGSRKRTFDDEIKLPAHAKLKKVNRMPTKGEPVYEWRPIAGENPRPWLVTDHSKSTVGNWLHKEILDFYDHIKPQDFEEHIRGELVKQLKRLCRDFFGDAEVYPFGSFPSGLYLPTGDIDLVLCSDAVYDEGRQPKYANNRMLYALKNLLVQSGVSTASDTEIIRHAKVPLVKFIESRTGLKIDVSFENLTGVTAIDTFLAWKEEYPAMPVLVTLVKHFLAMRGCNEPVNGGIGGFSVICLVVSLLQHRPDVQSRSMTTEHYYGDLLMDFFDFYGNRFNYRTTAISLNPPAYINKNRVTSFTYKNQERLSIIDPNSKANDISGGSMNIGTITAQFAAAHRDLRARMAELAKADDATKRGASILEVIFAGNYSTFRTQRAHLAALAERGLGKQPEAKSRPRRSQW